VNVKRVARIWRQEGLKVPQRQPKRNRLWLTAGSCIRFRPEYPNHVWAYDFITDRTHDGRAFRLLTNVDEFTRECLAVVVARKLTADDVLATLTDLFITRGCPGHLRSDNGPEFCAKIVREWLAWLEVRTLFIKPGSPWGNGYSESFNEKLRDELLDREIFYIHAAGGPGLDQGLAAALQHRATHSALGYRPPAPDARSWSKLAMSPRSELELLTSRN
jgi:transposase InsO family protein